MEDEFPGQLVHIDTHVSGQFNVAGGTARGARYGVGGIPHVQFDGLSDVVGAGSCNAAANQYRPIINNRLSTTAGVTPVDLSVEFEITGNQMTVTGTAELVDNIALTGLQMTLFIVEDDITWCCDPQGGDHFDAMTRGINSQPITITFGGGTVQAQNVFTLNPAWNADNMWAAAVVEYISGTREVFQAAKFRNELAVSPDQVIASAPDGSSEILVDGVITNGNEAGDTFDLTISGDQGGWTQEFQVEGDPMWYTNTSVVLAGGESIDVTYRINTNSDVVVGQVVLNAAGQTTPFSSNGAIRVFNGTKAVLFVDADKNNPREMHLPFTNALDAALPFYDSIVGNGPAPDAVAGYDLIVWETGFVSIDAVSASGGEALQNHLAAGGNLLISSMGLSTSSADTPALRTALGVAGIVDNVGTTEATGVTGDPITDGMFYVMDWLNPAYNVTDDITPLSSGGGTTVATIFTNEEGESNAIRQETAEGQRTVYNSIWAEGFGEDDDFDDEVVEAMITWVLGGGGDPASVDGAPFVSGVLNASPNPFSTSSGIQFALSDFAAGSNVSLKVVDANGRLVRDLYSGQLEAGSHTMEWDGRDNDGVEVANGLYFSVLKSIDGTDQGKLMYLR